MLYGEQERGLPFIRFINPTELDKARDSMELLLRLKYPGLDIANIHLWKMIGWDGGPIEEFINQYMHWSKTNRSTLTQINRNSFVDAMMASGIYGDRKIVDEYVDIFLSAQKAGDISDTIYTPYEYEETEPIEKIGKEVGKELNRLFLFGVLAIAGYGLMTTFIPQITKAISQKQKKGAFT